MITTKITNDLQRIKDKVESLRFGNVNLDEITDKKLANVHSYICKALDEIL